MIYTLTLNPALDYHLEVENLKLGETNRSKDEKLVVGGKGINVSLMLQNLGIHSIALGFLAGFSGKEISARLQKESFESRFIFLENGFSRINVKIKSDLESEINAKGPIPTKEKLEELLRMTSKLCAEDILVLSGSLAMGMSKDFYAQVMSECKALICLDASGEALELSLPNAPFLIKPNKAELEAIFDRKITNTQETLECAKKLQDRGARNVLVSLGGEGALFLDERQNCYTLKVPKGKLINSVGAGDSMVAGFIAGFLKTQDYKEAFYYSVASGSASAYSQGFGTQDKVEELLTLLKEEE